MINTQTVQRSAQPHDAFGCFHKVNIKLRTRLGCPGWEARSADEALILKAGQACPLVFRDTDRLARRWQGRGAGAEGSGNQWVAAQLAQPAP